jgi:hypothetical protein
MVQHVYKSPADFPDPTRRKKRELEVLEVAPPAPAKPPSRDEAKDAKKRDRYLLHVLKQHLQPVMDQINRRYKKFRQPVIPAAQLAHLFAEAEPGYVRPDVVGEPDPTLRPYEITRDRHGVDVLLETATGKLYYNLDTTTIEERLSNGFYARPSDFLFDIRSLARDAKNIGDRERTLKANELVSNVEVDMAATETQTAHIDWEALYQRQLARTRLEAERREERARERRLQQQQAAASLSSLSVAGAAGKRSLLDVEVTRGGNESDSGPVVLGEAIPGARARLTTARFQLKVAPGAGGASFDAALAVATGPGAGVGPGPVLNQNSSMQGSLNGSMYNSHDITATTQEASHLGNSVNGGSGVHGADARESAHNGDDAPRQPDPDVEMSGTYDETPDSSMSHHAAVSQPAVRNGHLSQRSAVTSLPSGVLPDDVANDAPSTKSTDTQQQLAKWTQTQSTGYLADQSSALTDDMPSTLGSGSGSGSGGAPQASQASASGGQGSEANGTHHHLQQQGSSSVGHQSSSSLGRDAPGSSRPTGPTSASHNHLTTGGLHPAGGDSQPSSGPRTASSSSQGGRLIPVDAAEADVLLDHLTDKTERLAIEQLEQVSRELMQQVWETRGEWNRNKVLSRLRRVFNEALGDIEAQGGALHSSQ